MDVPATVADMEASPLVSLAEREVIPFSVTPVKLVISIAIFNACTVGCAATIAQAACNWSALVALVVLIFGSRTVVRPAPAVSVSLPSKATSVALIGAPARAMTAAVVSSKPRVTRETDSSAGSTMMLYLNGASVARVGMGNEVANAIRPVPPAGMLRPPVKLVATNPYSRTSSLAASSFAARPAVLTACASEGVKACMCALLGSITTVLPLCTTPCSGRMLCAIKGLVRG